MRCSVPIPGVRGTAADPVDDAVVADVLVHRNESMTYFSSKLGLKPFYCPRHSFYSSTNPSSGHMNTVEICAPVKLNARIWVSADRATRPSDGKYEL